MEKEIQKKSLDGFFRNDYQKLLGYVRKNLENRFLEAEPEDIIQDVMLSIMDKFDLNEQIGNLTAYIYRSVKNRIIALYRQNKRELSAEYDYG